MIRISMAVAITLLAGLCGIVRADEWTTPQPKSYTSSNGKYALRITPSEPTNGSQAVGNCRADLFQMEGQKRTKVWSRLLINNVAPVRAMVADSGKYVVTLDEWHHVGKFPLVIYGQDGTLIEALNLRALGLSEYEPNIAQSASSYWWNENAIMFFGPTLDDGHIDSFFIRLHWGRMLVVNLRDGTVIDDAWTKEHIRLGVEKQLREAGTKQAAEIVVSMLKSQNPEDRMTWILASGQMKLKEAVPALRDLLTSSDHGVLWEGDKPKKKVYHIRQAAEQALEAIGEPVKDVIVEEPVTDMERERSRVK